MMKRLSLYVGPALIVGMAACGAPADPGEAELMLRADRPAVLWEEAYPIGNGRLGAVIYGGIEEERLLLNEDTLTAGEPLPLGVPDVRPGFDRVMEHIRRGEYVEADDYITHNWLGRAQQCYQPLGELRIRMISGAEDSEKTPSPVSDYWRTLDLRRAVAAVTYHRDEASFSREVFSSFPAQVIVMRLGCDRPGRVGFDAAFSSIHPTAGQEAEGGDTLVMSGQIPGFTLRRTLELIERTGQQHKYPEIYDESGKRRPHADTVLYGEDIDGKGMFFESRLQVLTEGEVAEVSADASGLHVRGADRAVLLLSADSSFNGFDRSPSREGVNPSIGARRDLEEAATRSYAALLDEHVADYGSLFDRVELSLSANSSRSTEGSSAGLGSSPTTTVERITRYGEGGDEDLAALLFQYGRYLMISGSRPGSQALNLQGLWSREVIPPWASGYTCNINAEMNYWPVEVAHLPECHEPLLNKIRNLAVNGEKTAAGMYGRRGWVAHHNVTLWNNTDPVDNVAQTSFWPMGAGWLSRHLWEHYAFTRDREFLKDAWPVLKGAARFLLDWMIEDEDGMLITPISTSPENRFHFAEGMTAATASGATMDMAIIRDLFSNVLAAGRILERDAEFREEVKNARAHLRPYRIGRYGQLQEWYHDWDRPEDKHRHVSFLFGFHPGRSITERDTPGLYAAARKSLEMRGDEGTGWSLAWKINFWARFKQGDRAHKLIRMFLRPALVPGEERSRSGVYPNLWCAHPPFQIDGNFGAAAGIAEMLLQSHTGEIELLPALPSAWPAGRVRGLRARGAVTVDIAWEDGRLTECRLTPDMDGEARLRYGDEVKLLRLKAGTGQRVRFK